LYQDQCPAPVDTLFDKVLWWYFLSSFNSIAVFGIHGIDTFWKIILEQTAGILKNNSDCKVLALIWQIRKLLKKFASSSIVAL